MWTKPIVVTDIETTGLLPGLNEVIELGAVKLHQPDMQVMGWFNTKIKPEHIELASPKALQVNGYTPEAWEDASDMRTAFTNYNQFAAGCVFAAYNLTFDWSFIDSAFIKLGIKHDVDYHRIDVLTLAWQFLRGRSLHRVSLKSVCQTLGVKPEPEVHRAVNGALTAARVLRAVCNDGVPLDALESAMDVVERAINGTPTEYEIASKKVEEVLLKRTLGGTLEVIDSGGEFS